MSFVRSFLFLTVFGIGLLANSFEIPELTSPVVDEVGLLSPQARRQLEENLFAFKGSNGVQLQVYIVKSLQGEEIESAAIKIFDKWKLGDEKTDKGLLFLVAPNEKRMRIEVGEGLEGDIPDVIAKRIISDVVRPYFQSGQFAIGIAQGVSTLENYITNADPNDTQLVKEKENRGRSKPWIILIVIAIWIIIFIFNPSLALYILFSAFRGGGGGGSGGGGSWSGGGGRSSGGGASGSW